MDEWLIDNEQHAKHNDHIKKYIDKAFENVNEFFKSYRPYLLAYWQNEQINFSLLRDVRLNNPVETMTALAERFLRQRDEFKELLPDTREVGMIKVECKEVKRMLDPQPIEYFAELQKMLPNIIKKRIEDETEWMR